MARAKGFELSGEAIASNAAGAAKRKKEIEARKLNAEKQRRFRESMKAQGYTARMIYLPKGVKTPDGDIISEMGKLSRATIDSLVKSGLLEKLDKKIKTWSNADRKFACDTLTYDLRELRKYSEGAGGA